MTELSQARAAKQHLREQLQADDDVVGVGLRRSGTDYCLTVNVCAPEAAQKVPRTVDGIEVRVSVVGRIRTS